MPAVVQAQNVKIIADREAARRQAHIPRGEEVLARAQSELHAKQYASGARRFSCGAALSAGFRCRRENPIRPHSMASAKVV